MNVSGKDLNNSNVLSLFGGAAVERSPAVEIDPLQALLDEAQAEAWETEITHEAPALRADQVVITAEQFPDQSMFLLEKQLQQLNERMGRLKFYLSDLDDLLPR